MDIQEFIKCKEKLEQYKIDKMVAVLETLDDGSLKKGWQEGITADHILRIPAKVYEALPKECRVDNIRPHYSDEKTILCCIPVQIDKGSNVTLSAEDAQSRYEQSIFYRG